MISFFINLVRRKRIILVKGYYVAQVFSLTDFKWLSVSRSGTEVYHLESSRDDYCNVKTFDEATQLLYRFIDFEIEERKRRENQAKEEKQRNKKNSVYCAAART